MIKGTESIALYSESAKKLADFYKEKVGLRVIFEGVMGEDQEVYNFDTGNGVSLYVMGSPKVKGENKEPERTVLNLEVDDIEKEVKRLEDAGAKKRGEIYHLENYGYIGEFTDPDGNYFCLVQVRA